MAGPINPSVYLKLTREQKFDIPHCNHLFLEDQEDPAGLHQEAEEAARHPMAVGAAQIQNQGQEAYQERKPYQVRHPAQACRLCRVLLHLPAAVADCSTDSTFARMLGSRRKRRKDPDHSGSIVHTVRHNPEGLRLFGPRLQ